ncbi:acetylgalactosaminyl-O-glycosyl-glycoprotein beta-1,3-N-acetylglucosaminyltransferase-like [Echeneis naucrates]|uniref:acetylgalactosaminyl-O-glycosyl-glycoprotein beta-1,3-N-acetylglucosaminyltransferase-like n=1 Tax=Echeneis naucrates TaxID=173247 RepID=UPI001113E12C|nr:acetylgalactosaminyl-O-glycosyl-glycoprotein beta-1,3-N-acetylglucosaminyltransferase-like [Echeneis naucrates]
MILRCLKRTALTIMAALLTVALLIAVNLQLDSSFNNIKFSQQNMKKDHNQKKPLPKNNSYICQQNLSAANMPGFSSFPSGIKDIFYYRHCRNFPVLLDLPGKCGEPGKSEKIFLLLAIKSASLNYDRREVLRKTWAEERLYNGVWIRQIFITGKHSTNFEKQELLKLEHQQYNDILQFDFEDTYLNLTLKQVLFLDWMEKNCQNFRFMLHTDDDVFANTDNIVQYLQSLKDNDGGKHLYIGSLMSGVPIRNSQSKYFIPVQMYESNKYPIYCSGGGYIQSAYTALTIHKMSQSIPLLPMEDVYMGMCLAKAELKPAHHMGIKVFGLRMGPKKFLPYDPCLYKEVLLVHEFSPGQIYVLWKSIHNPSLKCGSKK